ncbi:hypothetical protein F5B18DRAFT_651733 [Nemania serpens]|nr:hypothetical protein F5B18DRAFT_651733 [Nemania serpens]
MSQRRVATAQTHLSHHRPAPERVGDREWSWPYWKFGYTHGGVLFTDLHAEFNSVRCAIQDPYGWHLDVSQIANEVDSREAFFARLRQRQNERFAELEEAWHNTTSLLVGEPGRWDTRLRRNQLWINFVRISRNFSYDSLVGFFGAFVKDDPPRPKLPEPPRRDSQSPQHQSPNEPAPEEPKTSEIEPEQSSKIHEQKKKSPQSGKIRAETARARGNAKTSNQAIASPNRVVKRHTQRRKAERVPQDGIRRSARLRERKERGNK